MTTAERVVHKGVHEAPRSPFHALKYRMFVSVIKSVGPIWTPLDFDESRRVCASLGSLLREVWAG